MFVSGDRRYKVFVVSLFYRKYIIFIIGNIPKFVSMYLQYYIQMTVTDTNDYEQFVGPLCNVLKISNALRSLWNGTHDLRPLFGAYEQFVGRLWNVFLMV